MICPGIVCQSFESFAFEFVDVTSDLIKCCPSNPIEAEHLEGSFGGRAARVNENQHAVDQYGVDLDFEAVLLGAESLATTQRLFDHPEEEFDRPSQVREFCDDLGGKIEHVGDDPQ